MGIRVERVVEAAFALSGLLAGVGGILVAPLFTISSTMGTLFGYKAFAVAILGGIESAAGRGAGRAHLRRRRGADHRASRFDLYADRHLRARHSGSCRAAQRPVRPRRIEEGVSWRAAAAAALVTAAVCFLIARGDSYQTFIIVTVGLTAIVGVGLNVLLGLSGQISLGHVAFYAIGAYAVGILTTALDWPFWPALAVGGLVAGLAGVLLAISAASSRQAPPEAEFQGASRRELRRRACGRDLSFDARAGAITSIIGPNGAGKTTALDAICGFYRPDAGTVKLGEQTVSELRAHQIPRAGIARTYQTSRLFESLSVIDNVLIALRRGKARRRLVLCARRIEALPERFAALEARRHQRAGLVSSGEQQMLAIARGLMARPEVLMLDEPSLGLAPKLLEVLYDLLAELRGEGTTILLVDQMATLALSVADRAYVLQSGTIKHSGSAREVAGDPALMRAFCAITGPHCDRSAASGGKTVMKCLRSPEK